MADTTVTTNVAGALPQRNILYGPYWTDESTAYVIFLDGSVDVSYSKTTDGGATWNDTKFFDTATNIISANVWFDQETPGDTGTKIHLVAFDPATTNIDYLNLDTSTDTISSTTNITTSAGSAIEVQSDIAITKSLSGNLIMAFSSPALIGTYKSTNGGTSWSAITDFYESAGQSDRLLLFPANTGDDDDVVGIFHDASDTELSVKMYDNSADSITETSITTSFVNTSGYRVFDGSVRHSDNHLLVAVHSNYDNAIDDLLTFDITLDSIASPTVTAKTNVFTDQSESVTTSVFINQQNDDVYVAYQYGSAWFSLTDIYYKKSTDGMDTWGTEVPYSETTDDNRNVTAGRTVGNNGGKYQPVWVNDDLTDLFVNLNNDVDIAASTPSNQTITGISTIQGISTITL